MKRRQKRHEPAKRHDVPELPEARPMPSEASPCGTEGVDPGWPGGSSNVGEVLNPGFESPAPYSTRDLADDVPRGEVIAKFGCDRSGQAFQSEGPPNLRRWRAR